MLRRENLWALDAVNKTAEACMSTFILYLTIGTNLENRFNINLYQN